MFKILLAFVSLLLLSSYYIFRRSRKRLYELAAKIPGPFDLPLIGSIHVGIGRGATEIFNYMIQFLHTIPTPMRAWIGPLLFVVFDEPEHLAVILNSPDCVQKSYVYRFFRVESGLFNAQPDLWKRLRKHLNPSFSVSVVKNFVPTFNTKADNLIHSLDGMCGQGTFDMLPKAGEYSLSTTTVNALGLDLDNDNSDYKKRYLENADRMFTLMWTRIYKAWLHPQILYKLTSSYREECKRYVMFQEMSKKVFEIRKAERQQHPALERTADKDDDNVRRPQLFIERLEKIAADSDVLDEQGVTENLDTIIFAGNDTTASVISTTVLMLAMHPEVQERAHREILDVVPNDYIEYEDLSKLAYLEMVIKESMRLLPVGAVLARVCEKELQVGGYIIPAGTQVVIPIIKVHRSKKIWGERSEEFDPENFSPENCAKRNPYAFLSFSGGIRNCIGIKYSYITLKIVLTKLIKRYKFSTHLKLSDLKLHASIVMRIANGYMISLERRDKRASHS